MKLQLKQLFSGVSIATLFVVACSAAEPITNDREEGSRSARLWDHSPGANVAKSSDIVGAEVKNLSGEKLGKVDNLIVDLKSGRVLQVIVASGGFLGLGDELSSVPPTAFLYDPAQKVLQLDVTKEAMTKAPHFKRSEWPNVADPNFESSVNRAYKVQPNQPTDSVDADNSKRNARDRNVGRPAPFDQGSSKSDVEITRQIRKEIHDQKGLSINAQNIKIITAGGRVTLRGPVNSEEEKRSLAEIAGRVAQSDRVDNQLEVKRDVKE